MIRADQIPDKVWHTAMSTYHKTIRKRPGSAWQEAIAAAINAWPRMLLKLDGRYALLPLPQEVSDE